MSLILDGSTGISDIDGTAATPAIRGSDANTGIYFPGADRIGFSEGGTQVGEFDASGNFLFNSGYGSAAIGYGCRAWVNFNGTGTIAIRASGNVTSITDNGTGDYTVNFTTALSDANYSTVASCGRNLSNGGSGTDGMLVEVNGSVAPSTSAVRVDSYNFSFSKADSRFVNVAIFR